jgi:uncharacterized protein YecT (DUF1311 family)
MKKVILFIFLLFVVHSSFSQTKATINKIDSLYQSCLDSGNNMEGCSELYYYKIDSILNVVYKKLRLQYDSSQKIILRTEERKWLLDRKNYFIKVDNESDELSGQDRVMDVIDKKAKFVRDRVLELIKRLN